MTDPTHNSAFPWITILLVVGALLLIPLIAMQFTDEVNWEPGDFLIMGLMLFAAGCGLVWACRRLRGQRRVIVAGVVIIAFVYVWAELAVGIFTDWGS